MKELADKYNQGSIETTSALNEDEPEEEMTSMEVQEGVPLIRRLMITLFIFIFLLFLPIVITVIFQEVSIVPLSSQISKSVFFGAERRTSLINTQGFAAHVENGDFSYKQKLMTSWRQFLEYHLLLKYGDQNLGIPRYEDEDLAQTQLLHNELCELPQGQKCEGMDVLVSFLTLYSFF